MKKVILYGVRGTGRKEIEHFLSDSYEIIGYSDSDVEYSSYSHINFIRFFRPEELKTLSFDYLIITPKDLKVSNEIRDKLMHEGLQHQIIQYASFYVIQYPHPYDIYRKVSQNWTFAGIILGMSHANRGINVNLFHEPVFNFGFNSNDLFYFYHLIKKLKSENAGIDNIRYCILEMPYYIFNWDRSRSQSALKCMNAYTILGEYHHLDTFGGDL